MKKCKNCQVSVTNSQDCSRYYEITEITELNGTIEIVGEKFYCCEPCWHHKQENKKYLGKPYYSIWSHWPSGRTSEEEQQTSPNLISLYKEAESKGVNNINLDELEELRVLRANLAQWGDNAPINQQKKARREELEKKYSNNNPGRERERAKSRQYSSSSIF
ncbi:MAG: hypothetical protein GBAus27B_000437 [Mycoplasmataceae bacterium]|nr:MAG: hypothetical protein GBAus27B_000437 [Mycoplasmataceae bacterium]